MNDFNLTIFFGVLDRHVVRYIATNPPTLPAPAAHQTLQTSLLVYHKTWCYIPEVLVIGSDQ
jgi:hypothetical protein